MKFEGQNYLNRAEQHTFIRPLPMKYLLSFPVGERLLSWLRVAAIGNHRRLQLADCCHSRWSAHDWWWMSVLSHLYIIQLRQYILESSLHVRNYYTAWLVWNLDPLRETHSPYFYTHYISAQNRNLNLLIINFQIWKPRSRWKEGKF